MDFWENASLIIEPIVIDGAYEVTMMVCGRDTRFWAGDFGSKVCHCSVRVLCEEHELEGILVGAEREHNNDNVGVAVQVQNRRLEGQEGERNLLKEVIGPILFIMLFWLIS